jgi:hypothetical protein
MQLANQPGLWGLLALIPFILMYLIRPRAKEKEIPSLMFLMKNSKQSKQSSFFRYLMRNFLFFLQLILIGGLAFSLAMPYVTIPYKSTAQYTVVVLDGSASMQTKHGIGTRFDRAISEIKPKLTGKVSVIFAENQPLVLLTDGNNMEAMNLLSKLKAKGTTTNIGDALSVAKDILKSREGKVIVASDFVSDESSDLTVIRRDLMSKGNIVEFINVANKVRNIGIVDMDVDKYQTKIRIKNYFETAEDVTVKLIKDNQVLDEIVQPIAPNSIEALSFETPLGISSIELAEKDDLGVDNKAYISAPLNKKIRVLLITNKRTSNLMYALEASKDIDLEIRNPPTINAFNINHDIVLIDKIELDEVIPSDIVDVKRYVEKGGKLIVTAQDNLAQIDLLEMLPFIIEGTSKSSLVCIELINQFTQQFNENKCFTSSKYFTGSVPEGKAVIATAGVTPIMVLGKVKQGSVFYYGIFDDFSNFRTQPAYPIFWNELVNYLVETGDIRDYNYKTGSMLSIREQKVKTPLVTLTTSNLFLDDAGLYELEDKTVAANLLDEVESDVSGESIIDEQEANIVGGGESDETDLNLELVILAVAVFLLWIELFFIKTRGDL